jgi:drug/metabolite transporter (DMT)-like permease
MASIAIAWGGNWPVTKLALSEFPPWTYRAFGLILGALALLAIARAQGHRLRVKRAELGPLLLVALFNVTIFHITSAYALMMMDSGRVVIIVYTYPLWTVMLDWMIRGARPTPGRIAALAMGLGALLMLIWPDIAGYGGGLLGPLLILATAVSWALGTVLYKRYRWSLSSMEFAGWQLLLGGLPIVAGAALFETPPDPFSLSTPVVVATIYALVVAMVYGHWAWFTLLGVLSPSVAAIAMLSNPVIGVFASALLLGERLGWREYAALALVVGGLAILVRRR